MISPQDWPLISGYNWHKIDDGYFQTRIKGERIYIHRLIMSPKDGEQIDHINHNPADNRRENLRICTSSQNSMNRKNVKGYSYNKRSRKYKTQIAVNSKEIHLGYFDTAKEARETYLEARKHYFEEFARVD